MDGIRFLNLHFIGLVGLGILNAQIVPPVLIDKTEPEYNADFKNYVVDPARVQMIVDERGNPFALNSTTSLPDNVVQALAKWRFRPGMKNRTDTAYAVVVDVSIRRPLNRYLDNASRPSDLGDKPWEPARKAGTGLTPGKAAELERKLKDHEDSADGRTELLAFAASRSDKDAVDMRARQISWFVRNRSGSGVLGSSLALISARPGALQDAPGYELIKNLWLDQVAKDPDDATILGHATWFLQLEDPEQAEKMLIPSASKIGGAAAWLGELYAFAALGVKRINPADGKPTEVGEQLPDTGYALHARSILAGTRDDRILLSAIATVTRSGRQLNQIGKLPAGYSSFCQELLSQVSAFYSDTPYSCEIIPANSGGVPSASSEMVEPARLTKKISPTYPPEAKSRGIQGTVHFSATIGKDGKLEDLQLLSGPLIFYNSSRKAVLQWEYRPTALNGVPVTVITRINVNYALQ